jgi:hypothetical protein
LQEAEAAAEALEAKENGSDTANEKQAGHQKAAWHRATGAVAKPLPPKLTPPCPAPTPAPDTATHSAPSTDPSQHNARLPLRVRSQPLMLVSVSHPPVPYQATAACVGRRPLRTPTLRRAVRSDDVKISGSNSFDVADQDKAKPVLAVPARERPVSLKRKFVPPRPTT